MGEIEKLRLCGGIFLDFILEKKRRTLLPKQKLDGKTTRFTQTAVLRDLILIAEPNFFLKGVEPQNLKGTFETDTNEYKKCIKSYCTNIPFDDEDTVRKFDNRIKTSYADALTEMTAFTEKYLSVEDTDRMLWIVNAILAVMKQDTTISNEGDFFCNTDGSTITKSELLCASSVSLPAFLLGIWHYCVMISTKAPKNVETYNTLYPKGRVSGNQRKLNPAFNILDPGVTSLQSGTREGRSAEKEPPLIDHNFRQHQETDDPIGDFIDRSTSIKSFFGVETEEDREKDKAFFEALPGMIQRLRNDDKQSANAQPVKHFDDNGQYDSIEKNSIIVKTIPGVKIGPGNNVLIGGTPLQTTRTFTSDGYNLFVGGKDASAKNVVYLQKDRVLTEYIDILTGDEFLPLSRQTVAELKKMPAIICDENDRYSKAGDEQEAIYGYIKDIHVFSYGARIYYQPLQSFRQQVLNDIAEDLEIEVQRGEMSRTHWTVKKIDLVGVLHANGIDVVALS